MKTILVPVDFSKNSGNALNLAINLSQKLGAKLILFHSFYSHHSNVYGSPKSLDQETFAAKYASDQQLQKMYSNAVASTFSPPEYISNKNELRDEILRLVAEKGVDLIVMGTQGSGSKLEGQLFGTNTSWVVEHATCPVLVIPETLQVDTLKNIVYASNYSPADIGNLKTLVRIAESFEATITVIHITKEESEVDAKALEDFEQQVNTEIEFEDIHFKLLKGNNVEKSLEQYMEVNKVDLLVMSAHQRNITEKLFGKSITKAMTLYSHISLMVFHHTVDSAT